MEVIYKQSHFPSAEKELFEGDKFTGIVRKEINSLKYGEYQFYVISHKTEPEFCENNGKTFLQADTTAVEIRKNNKFICLHHVYNVEKWITDGYITDLKFELTLFNN